MNPIHKYPNSGKFTCIIPEHIVPQTKRGKYRDDCKTKKQPAASALTACLPKFRTPNHMQEERRTSSRGHGYGGGSVETVDKGN